jgi:psp operon transcriptional activator
MIGASSAWAEALDHVSQLAAIDRAALIIGERGTGKELIAERLHFLSPRWENTLVKVNCASFSESLLESELFGHESGAFTGATGRHLGRFERASGGTLFLDELGTLPDRVQEKILRVIEYGEFERLGSQETQQVDIRIIAATNADLPKMVAAGTFRGDLLDRLAFDVIQLPPLRQRAGDINELCNYFAIRMSHELGWDLFPGFSEDALKTLNQWHWPGNVRELKNVVERSVYRWGQADKTIDEVIIDPFAQNQPEPTPNKNITRQSEADSDTLPFTETVLQFERGLIEAALQDCHHHQGETAKQLGLSYHQFRGLYRKHKFI